VGNLRSRHFEIVGNVADIETIATGSGIRGLARLRKQFGPRRWRELQGVANVRLANGHVRTAELHWYETHGIGKRKLNNQTLPGLGL